MCFGKHSGWVGVAEWVVEAEGVAVEVLGGEWRLHHGVGAEDAAQGWVVEPRVHVDESEVAEVLVRAVSSAK